MKERPILFSAPMVRALLAGTKTQTRRLIKPQPISNGFGPPDPVHDIPCHCDYYPPSAMLWPDEQGGMLNGDAGHPWHGVDRLWVKETHVIDNPEYVASYKAQPWLGMPDPGTAEVFYMATEKNPDIFPRKRPSIFMPRWASRISLEITDVTAERLQKISEADAKAEGVDAWQSENYRVANNIFDGYRLAYAELWNEINGPGSWAKNPWVWVVSFRRVET